MEKSDPIPSAEEVDGIRLWGWHGGCLVPMAGGEFCLAGDVDRERTALRAALAAAEARIAALTAERDELAAHIAYLHNAIGQERLSIWRDIVLSVDAQEAVAAFNENVREAEARAEAAEAQVAALSADRGELGRQVRDLKKRAEGAESDRDRNRDVALEYEAQVAALTGTLTAQASVIAATRERALEDAEAELVGWAGAYKTAAMPAWSDAFLTAAQKVAALRAEQSQERAED